MAENQKCLTTRQRKAIPVILASRTITEGVTKAGVTRETFYQWIKDPEFKAEFTGQRQQIIDLALHELKTSTSEAVSVLRGLLKAEGESVRLRTAQAILENVFKSIEIENIEMRLEALEREVGNEKTGKTH